MAQHFETLLRAIVEDPQQSLSAFRILPREERQRLLSDWAETGRAELEIECAHQIFERHAAARPEAEAVKIDSTTQT